MHTWATRKVSCYCVRGLSRSSRQKKGLKGEPARVDTAPLHRKLSKPSKEPKKPSTLKCSDNRTPPPLSRVQGAMTTTPAPLTISRLGRMEKHFRLRKVLPNEEKPTSTPQSYLRSRPSCRGHPGPLVPGFRLICDSALLSTHSAANQTQGKDWRT